MKKLLSLVCVAWIALGLVGCNTWAGLKQDAKEVGHAAGQGIEKAGEKIQDVSK